MKKLFSHLKKYRLEAVLGPAFKLLEASFELMVPLIVAAIIDTGIPGGDRGYILRMCGVLALLAAVGLACSLTAQYFAARAATGFAASVRHQLMEKIGQMSYAELDRAGASTLITRMSGDVDQLQSGMNLALRLLLRSPFVVFGAMIMAFTVDAPSAVVFAVVIPALCVVVFGIMLITIPLYRRVQQLLDRVSAGVRGNINGTRVVRAFGRERDETEEFDRRLDALTAVQRLAGAVSALMNPITLVMINIAVIVLIRTGALRVEAGLLTQGSLVALYNYMTQILTELIKMADLIINITRAVACGGRIQSAIDSVEGMPVLPESGLESGDKDCAVEFRHVSFRYDSAAGDALHDVSFSVRPGETVGVIGGTGSGKSTLVNLIPRFYDATAGAVLVGGADVRGLDPAGLRREMGVVPQHAALFSGTIRDNLLFSDPDATDSAIDDALRASQAYDFVTAKPEGLDTVLGEGGAGLSGGQRQRLTVARALVRRPGILILDDSSSALDYATDAALRRSLRRLDFGPTVFIVSQRVSSVRGADRIIVLDDGSVAGIGTHAELLESCPVYREICESQHATEEVKCNG